jgi:hypothetical protein
MIHHCVPLLIGVFRPGLAERRIVLEKKIQINPVPPAGLLRSEIAQLEARFDGATLKPGVRGFERH